VAKAAAHLGLAALLSVWPLLPMLFLLQPLSLLPRPGGG
jgi:hypothetical protein